MFRLLFLAFFILVTALLAGQRSMEEIVLPYPLEQEQITFISQSSDGIYWFAGVGGLIRFDGATAERRWIADENTSEISHDQNVQSPMFEDEYGQLWFSTVSAFHCFDPKTNQFSTFQLEQNGYVIRENYRPFYLDRPQGELWIQAGDQIWRWRIVDGAYKKMAGPTSAINFTVKATERDGEFEIFGSRWMRPGIEYYQINQERDYTPNQLIAGDLKSINTLALGGDSLLIGSKVGLYLMTDLADPDSLSRLFPELLHASISGMNRTNDGEILISSHREAVYSLAPSTFSPKLLTPPTRDIEFNPDKIFVDNYDALWISRPGNGFYVFRSSTWFSNLAPPPGEEIVDLVQTGSHDVLIYCKSTNYYLGRLTVPKEANFSIPSVAKWSLITASERLQDPDQKLFFSKNRVFSVGYKWFGELEPSTNTWMVSSKPKSSLRELFVLAGDKILVTETGFYKSAALTNEGWSSISTLQPNGNTYFTDIFVINDTLSLLEYQGNQLWHLTDNNGEINIREKTFVPINPRCALLNDENVLYIGTNSGLYSLDDGTIAQVSEPTGQLAMLDILSMTFSASGDKIWLGTRKGLYAYDPKKAMLAYYSKESGLPYDQFLRIPPITLPEGNIGMTTNRGIIVFSPSGPEQQNEATPYLASVKVNDLPYDQNGAPRFLPSITRPYAKNSFDFEFSVITDGFSQVSAVEYQLLNHEIKPIRVAPGTTIHYPNLPPGNYTLQLTAINRNGLPSGKKSLKITINPPYWETWWFRSAAVLAIALIAAGIYFLGLRRERLKQQRLQEQQARLAAERDRIAGEVHDDLGGQISSILYLSEEMLLTGDTPEYEYELSRINELSRSSLQNVRDIIFALDNRRASLSALGEQLSGAGEAFFGDRKIGFRHTESFAQPEFILTSRQKRNLTLIIKEAWHNIAKHAKATVVTLNIQEVDQKLIITVADNGVGFTSTTSDNGMGGYGLDNMQEKATVIGGQLAIDSTPGKGTSLQITWPLPVND